MKKTIAIILGFILIMGITLPAAAFKTVAVKGIKLDKSKISLKVGQTYKLKVTLTPQNTTQKNLTFVTANKAVATVDASGTIKGVGKGTTTINVYTYDKKIYAKCQVTVSLNEPVKLSVMIISNATWPYQEDWVIEKLIEENANVKLEISPVLSTGYNDRLHLDLASGELCDIINTQNSTNANLYGPMGAFVNIRDQLDNLPNYKKFYKENESDVDRFKTAEGSWYIFNNSGVGETNRQGWMYRKDIFKKHNLSVPTNEEELYSVLKKLKGLYPDSTPLLFRQNLIKFGMFGPVWGTGWDTYFNFGSKEWKYGPIEDNFKEMAMFFNKLYKEGLMPADWLTIDNTVFNQLVSTEKAFVMLDYVAEIDNFNTTGRKANTEFEFAYMPPIKTKNGVAKTLFSANSVGGFAVKANSRVVKGALKYMDWLYSDAAKELVSWGKEGITYDVKNGKRTYIGAENNFTTVRQKYGLCTNGFYTLYDFNAQIMAFSESVQNAFKEASKYDLPVTPATPFTSQEQKSIIQGVQTNLQTYTKQEVAKFVNGIRPFTEWDKYVKEIKDLGVDKVVSLYKNADTRLKAKKK